MRESGSNIRPATVTPQGEALDWARDRSPEKESRAASALLTHLRPRIDAGEHPLVVDIGSGRGRDTEYLAKNGCEVVSVEPSHAFRQITIKRLEGTAAPAHVVAGRGQELPVAEGVADAVLAGAVFHYHTRTDAEKYMAEAARILKPGGMLAMVVRSINDNEQARRPILDSAGYTAADLFDDEDLPAQQGKKEIVRHYFSEEELRALAEQGGFDISDILEQERNVRAERGLPAKFDEKGHVRIMRTYQVMLRKRA